MVEVRHASRARIGGFVLEIKGQNAMVKKG
jgi:hypothetical protein